MNISVLGDGGWGTAQAILLAGKKNNVTLWSAFQDYAEELDRTRRNRKFLPHISIPKEIRITADVGEAVSGCELVVLAVPSRFFRSVTSRLKGRLKSGTIALSVAKGLEPKTLKRMTEVIAEELGPVPVAVLSGPSHAEEVARGIPTAVVVASADRTLAQRIQSVYTTERFKVYTHTDVIGVELGGTLKNVIAISCGLSDGLGLGSNTKAALISRGVAEISRLGIKLGARAQTFFGLSCAGDLVTTCISQYGRNLMVGRELAKGRTLQDVTGKMEMVAEGVGTTRAALTLARREQVFMPIAEALEKVMSGQVKPLDAVLHLMLSGVGAEEEDETAN